MMTTAHYGLDPRMPSSGLGFMIETRCGQRIFGHHAGWPGYSGSIRVAPQAGAAVVALTNTAVMASGFATIRFANEVIGRLVDDLSRDSLGVSEDPDLWPQLCGSYRPETGFNTNLRTWRLLGGRADVAIQNGYLVMRAPLGPLKAGMRLPALHRICAICASTRWYRRQVVLRACRVPTECPLSAATA